MPPRGRLATTQALAEVRKVQHDPTDVQAIRALEDASEVFRSLARNPITLVEDDEVELQGNWSSRLWLPLTPVIDVASVSVSTSLMGSVPMVLAGAALSWNRRGLLQYWGAGIGSCSGWGGDGATVNVTYSHGYDVIPGDVEVTVLNLATRLLANRNAANSEAISAYQISYGGLSVEDQNVIKKYRPWSRP